MSTINLKSKESPFVDIIYSFSGMSQKFDKCNISQHTLNDKELFFVLLTAGLSNEEKENLCKISCCVYWAEKLNMSEAIWYNEQNGKFWDNEIPNLIKKMYSIECNYTPINQ